MLSLSSAPLREGSLAVASQPTLGRRRIDSTPPLPWRGWRRRGAVRPLKAGRSVQSPGDLSNPDTQQQVLEGGPPSARALAIQVGATFTEGWDIVDVTGTRPVRIVDITFPDTDPGLTHLPDPLLAGPDRGPASIQYFPTFPPARWSGIDPSTVEPAIGAVLDPVADPEGNGWELLLGARPETAGNHWRRGARIHYEVLDRQGQPVGGVQALDLESDLYICATIGKPRGSADCDFPDDYSLSDTYPD